MRRAIHQASSNFLKSRASTNLITFLPQSSRCLTSSLNHLAVKPLKLSDIGEGTKDVEIMKWLVSEGDEIEAWADVVEVQSDKSTVNIQSPKEGIIKKIHHEVGDTVLVGATLVDIDYPGEGDDDEEVEDEVKEEVKKIMATGKIKKLAEKLGVALENVSGSGKNGRITEADVKAAAQGSSSSSAASSSSTSSPNAQATKPKATPKVRKYAENLDVDLSLVTPSGQHGNITQDDIDEYLAQAAAPAPTQTSVPATSSSEYKPVDISALAEPKTMKLSAIQKAMVKSMNAANQIPHFGYSEEYDLTALVETRKLLKDSVKKQYGINLSYMPFIIKAVSMALHDYPMLNASVNNEETEMTWHNRHNIGVAVDTPHGLLVPNVKDCQGRSILEIASELLRLVEAGRNNKLSPADMADGTFALRLVFWG